MFSLLLHFEVLLNRVSFDDPFGFHVDISIFRIRLKIAFESELKFRFGWSTKKVKTKGGIESGPMWTVMDDSGQKLPSGWKDHSVSLWLIRIYGLGNDFWKLTQFNARKIRMRFWFFACCWGTWKGTKTLVMNIFQHCCLHWLLLHILHSLFIP